MLRRLHTYMSIVSAPIILFFCLTGSLQLFNWHESRGAYHAPAWIEKLGTLHKKQRFAVRGGAHGGPPNSAPGPGAGPAPTTTGGAGPTPSAPVGAIEGGHQNGFDHGPPAGMLRVQLLRWTFLLAALSLSASTVMGVWIGLTHARRKRLCWLLLATGTLLPVLMLAL